MTLYRCPECGRHVHVKSLLGTEVISAYHLHPGKSLDNRSEIVRMEPAPEIVSAPEKELAAVP